MEARLRAVFRPYVTPADITEFITGSKAGACTVASQLLNRPVTIVVSEATYVPAQLTAMQTDLATNMKIVGKRHPMTASYNVGYDDDGVLHAIKVRVVAC